MLTKRKIAAARRTSAIGVLVAATLSTYPIRSAEAGWKEQLDLQHAACRVAAGENLKPSTLTRLTPPRPPIPATETRLLMVGDIALHVPVTYAEQNGFLFDEVPPNPPGKYYPHRLGRGNGTQFARGDLEGGQTYVAGRSTVTIDGRFLSSNGWAADGTLDIELFPYPSGARSEGEIAEALQFYLTNADDLIYSEDCNYMMPRNGGTTYQINTAYLIQDCESPIAYGAGVGSTIYVGRCFGSVGISVRTRGPGTKGLQDSVLRAVDFARMLLKK